MIYQIDSTCNSCGACTKICPVSAIQINRSVFVYPYRYQIDKALCTGCGLCAKQCPQQAIFRCKQ